MNAARPSSATPGKWVLPAVEIFYEGQFREGTSEEAAFTAADIHDMAENYQTFSEGPRPPVTPGVGIGHDTPEGEKEIFERDDVPNRGRVLNGSAQEREIDGEKKAVFVGDLEVDADVAAWVENGNLTRVSAEVYDEPPPEAKGGKGKTLKRVALLGFHPPELKRLAPLPKPVFVPAPAFTYSARTAAIRVTKLPGKPSRFAVFSELTKTPIARPKPKPAHRFSEGSTMDRAAALQICTDHGVTTITDATPDDVVIALAQALQQIDQMKQQAGGGGGAATAAAEAERQAKAITLKYAELENKAGRIETVLKGVLDHLKSSEETAKTRAEAERVAAVHAFAEQMKTEGRISVADADPEGPPTNIVNRLLRADNTRLHKFGEAGKEQQKTDLQLQMDEIRALPARKFTEKVAAGGAAGSGSDDVYKRVREKRKAELESARKNGGRPGLAQRLGNLPSRL